MRAGSRVGSNAQTRLQQRASLQAGTKLATVQGRVRASPQESVLFSQSVPALRTQKMSQLKVQQPGSTTHTESQHWKSRQDGVSCG